MSSLLFKVHSFKSHRLKKANAFFTLNWSVLNIVLKIGLLAYYERTPTAIRVVRNTSTTLLYDMLL